MEETAAAAAATLFSALPLHPSDDTDSNEEEEEEEEERGGRRRSMCYGGCGRPSSVCICSYLPTQPLSTSTQIILLHHPHALKSSSTTTTLSTLPPLISSLLNLHPIPGRKLRLGSHPLLDSLSSHPHSRPGPALFLFPSLPSSPSLPLSHWARQHTPPARRASPVLVVFDGTWTQAREMATASLPFLSAFATHVSVGDCDERAEGPSSYESELALRKEPFKGCVTTLEAVARALRALEPDEAVGAEVEERLVGVLRAMVGFQTRHLKPSMPRIKTRKKKDMRKQGKESGVTRACSQGEKINRKSIDYRLHGSSSMKIFRAFNALGAIAFSFGDAMLPEIQSTVKEPAKKNMYKGISAAYGVIVLTYWQLAFTGYWAFGSQVQPYIVSSLTIPEWTIVMANIFAVIQISGCYQIYCRPTYAYLEEKMLPKCENNSMLLRNFMWRLALTSIYIVLITLIAAAIPFFGDFVSICGAVGFTPLDFVFPALAFLKSGRLPKRSSLRLLVQILNLAIAIWFSIVAILGCIGAIRFIVLDIKTYKFFHDI